MPPLMKIPKGLSFLSSDHRIVKVPQDGNCALHVIMRALPDTGVSPVALRLVLSARITTENFKDSVRYYAMTSAPHIRTRILACQTVSDLRAILNHASYYLTNDDLIDLGGLYGFYPVIVNQKYNGRGVGTVLTDTLLLCDPFNFNESHLRSRFFASEIPAVLFYNRSDITHYEALEYNREGTWTGLILDTELDATLRAYIQTSCTMERVVSPSPVVSEEEKADFIMNTNTQYMKDIADIQSRGYVLRRTSLEHGETVNIQKGVKGHRYDICVSTRYPFERPLVLRDDIVLDIGSFWTPQTTLVELIQPSQLLEERYLLYMTDKTIVRPLLLQAARTYNIKRPGLAKMRRSVLCMYIADFETMQSLVPFTQSRDEDDRLATILSEMSV